MPTGGYIGEPNPYAEDLKRRLKTLAPGEMVKCVGCGFLVEPEDAREAVESLAVEYWAVHCLTCRECTATPKMRESYRRGFNAGLDALSEAISSIVAKSNLRKLL